MRRLIQNVEIPVSLLAITLALGLGMVEIEASASISKSTIKERMSKVPGHLESVTFAVASHVRRLAHPDRLDFSLGGETDNLDRATRGTGAYPVRIDLVRNLAPMQSAAGDDLTAVRAPDTVGDSVIQVVAALPDVEPAPKVESSGAAVANPRRAGAGVDRNAFIRAFKGFSRTDRSLIHVIDVQYNLAGGKSAGMGLDIRKKLEANGAPKGEVALRIVNDSKILASTSDVARALGGDALSGISRLEDVAGGQDYVDFDDLRAAGIAVRYDPVRDRVVMTSERS